MNASPTFSKVSANNSSSSQDLKPFLVGLILLTMLLAAIGVWKDMGNSVEGRIVQDPLPYQASLTRDAQIEKWLRDRATDAFNVEVVSHDEKQITVKYQARLGSGAFAEQVRMFSFGAGDKLESATLVSTSSGGKTVKVAEAAKARPATVEVGSIDATSEEFPWGVRAENARKAKLAEAAKQVPQVDPVVETLKTEDALKSEEPAKEEVKPQALPEDFPWGVRGEKARAKLSAEQGTISQIPGLSPEELAAAPQVAAATR